MATITLRAYLEELSTLIEQEALEEVIGHCRHILQYFPKNLETYRLLGKALLEKARYNEAAQVFPRILSADPSDFVAHIGLSTIYETQNEIRRALWHMERAFEQMPNQIAIGDEIRRLYEMMGKVPPEKIKMTRGALAKQYAANGMYDQALSEVRQALQDNSTRIDLKILLAEILWQANFPVEAGEAALEVLQVLPDSLAANILMAKLWLVSQRPDDAKVFLKHVEDLAPYKSLQLIYQANNQKAEVPDTAFTLNRLDWTTAAATGFGDDAPDWVGKISDVFQITDTNAVTGAESFGETTSPMAAVTPEDDDRPSPFAEDEIPDWVTGTGPLSSDAVSTSPAISDDLPDWFAEGADFGGKPQTGELSAPEEWFTEMTNKVSQTGSLDPDQLDDADSSSGFTGVLDEVGESEGSDDLDSLRAAAAAPSQAEIDALIASARGESPFAEEDIADEPLPPNWLDSTPDEPDWGDGELDSADDFVPDWFSSEDGDEGLATILDDDEEETEVDLFADSSLNDDDEFATLFGEAEESSDDLATIFGTDSETFDQDIFDEPETEESEPTNLESSEDALESMFGDMTAETSSEGFASIFGEGDLDDEPSLFAEDDAGELDSIFGSEVEGLDTSWLSNDSDTPEEEDEPDLDSLFGEEVDVDTSFLTATGFAKESTATSSADEELDLFGAETFDLSEEPDAEEMPPLSFAEDDSAASDDELASIFSEETEGLDTSWLAESSDGDDWSEAEAEDEPDLDSLFGEEVDVDTSFLTATGFAEESADEELDLFGAETFDLSEEPNAEEMPPLSFAEDDSAASDDELASIFSEETEGLDTSWLAESSDGDDWSEAEAEDEPDLDSLFGEEVDVDTSFLTATGFAEESADEELDEAEFDLFAEEEAVSEPSDLASVFDSETEGLDTSWLAEEENDAVSEAEADLDSLFGEEVEVDTSFLDATGFNAQTDTSAEPDFASSAEMDDEDAEEFDALFADEVGINTGFLNSAGLEEADAVAEDEFEANLDEVLEADAPDVMGTSWLSESAEQEALDLTDSSETDLETLFSEDMEPADATSTDDWLGSVESSDLTTEAVESLDTLLEDDELPEPSVDDLSDLFDDEGITVDTSFLRSIEDEPEDDSAMTIEASADDDVDDTDFDALFDSPSSGTTGFLQTAELTEADDSAIDEFIADAEAEAMETAAESEEEFEPEVDAELGDSLFAEMTDGQEEALDLDMLFGGDDDSTDDVLLRQSKIDEEPSVIDDLLTEIDEADIEEEPDLEDFFDPAELDFVTTEVETISNAEDDLSSEFEELITGDEAVTVETVAEDDLDAIFGGATTSPEPDFAELLEDEPDFLHEIEEDTEDEFAALLEDIDAQSEEAEDEFAELLTEDIFADTDDEPEDEFAALLDEDVFDTLDEDEGEFAALLENVDAQSEEAEDEFAELLAEDIFEELDEGDDELAGLFDTGEDALFDDLEIVEDIDVAAEESVDDWVASAEDEADDAISVDEFASVFGSVELPEDDTADDDVDDIIEDIFEDEVAIEDSEELEPIDDDLFRAMTSGEETIGLIEDSELTEELDWVTDFSEDEEVVAVETASSPVPSAPPTALPEAPRVNYTFTRQPRWMKMLKTSQSATMVNDVADEADLDSMADDFDDLLDDEFDDLLDDDLTDWLE